MSDDSKDSILALDIPLPGRKLLKAKRSLPAATEVPVIGLDQEVTSKAGGLVNVEPEITSVANNTVVSEDAEGTASKELGVRPVGVDTIEDKAEIGASKVNDPLEITPMEVDVPVEICKDDCDKTNVTVISAGQSSEASVADEQETSSVFSEGALKSSLKDDQKDDLGNDVKETIDCKEVTKMSVDNELNIGASEAMIVTRTSESSTADFHGFDLKANRQEVIDISDDDEDDESADDAPPAVPKRVDCCNLQCTTTTLSKVQQVDAPPFVLSYFGLATPRRVNIGGGSKVCEVCFHLALAHYKDMITALDDHTPLFHLELPDRHNTVVLSDSDSENDLEISTTEFLSTDVVNVLNEHLQDSIDETVERCNLRYQLREAKNVIEDKVDEMAIDFQDTLALQIDTQTGLDRLRHEFYTFYLPKRTELNPVEIVDLKGPPVVFAQPNSLTPPKSGKVAMKKVTQVRTYGSGVKNPQQLVNNSEVVALEQVSRDLRPKIPPIGPLVRNPPREGDMMYAMKFDLFGIWAIARIVHITYAKVSKDSESQTPVYRVRFDVVNRKQIMKTVNGKQLAYTQPCNVRYPVGTRVIAIFKDGEGPVELYYAGVVAEPPKILNNFRYLIFFDDGYTQYVHHDKVLLVAECSRLVCDDVHPDSRSFIKQYMEQYPERPMVKVALGQNIKTEWNGKWWLAKVIEVDCSLCNMNFLADGRTEWLYRGSTRMAPLYNELARVNPKTVPVSGTRSRSQGTQGVSNLRRSNMPYVEYTRSTEADADSASVVASPKPPEASEAKTESRAVAKKSTTRRPYQLDNIGQPEFLFPHAMPAGKGPYSQTLGKVKMDCYDVSGAPPPKKFVPHQCGFECISWVEYVPEKMKFCGPLAVPLLCGWRRETLRFRGKKAIVYKAPCGRHIRQMDELGRYLRVTTSPMGVDYFDFDFWVSCLSEFVLPSSLSLTHIQDLSDGKEYIPVPCVNEISYETPEYVIYTSQRYPVQGVQLNLDTEFLIGCNCTDGCQNKDKCACWQLTFAGTAYEKCGVVDNTIGYTHKRLLDPVLTGIYECNSRCSCNSTCANRVVQNPLRAKLQVFKTTNRGWGIRSINDMPQGSFICIYAGRLLNEHEANEGGKNYGDEYLAELDYIEVVERMKDGYEDQVKELLGDGGNEKEEDMEDGEDDAEERESSRKGGAKKSDEDSQDSLYRSDEDYQPDSSVDPTSIRARLRNRTPKERKENKDAVAKRTVAKRLSAPSVPSTKKEEAGDDDCIVLSDDEDVNIRVPQRFAPDSMDGNSEDKSSGVKSIRDFFQETDMCYIMDAKTMGNIGRYLNHSCTPNVFVQNVFVDTHDLRFPWVAFFALSYIPAGTELTWDYNYDIGSVPGKALHCHCGSADCRGRLL